MNTVLSADIQNVCQNEELFDVFRGKTILVTGATGLIGSNAVMALAKANELYQLNLRIIAHARNRKKAELMFKDTEQSVIIFLTCELAEIDEDCDFILHTACPTVSKYFITNPVETIDISVNGTLAMLKLAAKQGAKLIYLSSMEQYGMPYETDKKTDENSLGMVDHLKVRSCYPMSKRMCENLCVSFASEYGADVCIVRLAQTFGAGVPVNDNRLFMQLAKSVIHSENIVLHTYGKSTINFVYLSDCVRGIFTVFNHGVTGEAYNICNDEETRTVSEIAEMVAKEIANGKISVVYDVPQSNTFGYAPDVTMRLSSDKLKKLGWKPAVSMPEAYRKLIGYLMESGD